MCGGVCGVGGLDVGCVVGRRRKRGCKKIDSRILKLSVLEEQTGEVIAPASIF